MGRTFCRRAARLASLVVAAGMAVAYASLAPHDKKALCDLAVSEMNVGYQNDLSYFLPGEAANGCGESCEGFELKMYPGTASK